MLKTNAPITFFKTNTLYFRKNVLRQKDIYFTWMERQTLLAIYSWREVHLPTLPREERSYPCLPEHLPGPLLLDFSE